MEFYGNEVEKLFLFTEIEPKSSNMMKAMVCNGYGPPEDVFRLKMIEKPVPKDNEVLIKILATTATSGDCKLRGFHSIPTAFWLPSRLMVGLTKPRQPIWGLMFSGIIEKVGDKVKLFKEGEEVYGSTEFAFGAYAQYKCLPENSVIVKKPTNLSFEESVAITFGVETAEHFLKLGKIEKGQKVLIYGASGSVGTASVQLAKHYGADVTGVCSEKNFELVKSLGAEKVIDYTKEDFRTNGEKYDIIFDTIGKTSFSSCRNSLTSNGHYLLAVYALKELFQMLWRKMVGGQKMICSVSGATIEKYEYIKKLAESGAIEPVIDCYFNLEEMAQAHKYVEEGHKKGNVIIRVNHDE